MVTNDPESSYKSRHDKDRLPGGLSLSSGLARTLHILCIGGQKHESPALDGPDGVWICVVLLVGRHLYRPCLVVIFVHFINGIVHQGSGRNLLGTAAYPVWSRNIWHSSGLYQCDRMSGRNRRTIPGGVDVHTLQHEGRHVLPGGLLIRGWFDLVHSSCYYCG